MNTEFVRKWIFRAALAALLTVAPGRALAQGTLKMATVDLTKLFDGYYKTKQADAQILERVDDANKVLNTMYDEYKKANEDYKKSLEAANNQALAADAREKQKKTAETKLREIQDIEKTVQQFKTSTGSTIDEQKRRMRDRILSELRDAINAKAKAGNFNLVVDGSADSFKASPIFLYAEGITDLTEDLLTQMNAKAPPGALKPEQKASGSSSNLPAPSPGKEKEK